MKPAGKCRGTPISFLVLERYLLGDLDVPKRESVRQHLEGCPACATALGELEHDTRAFSLPEAPRESQLLRFTRTMSPFAGAGASLALAAATLLYLRPHEDGEEASLMRSKGAGVVLSLESEDGALEAGTPPAVSPRGSALRAFVTCPANLHVTFQLVVFDDSGASSPIAPASVACGNRVALPGAFRLTGDDTKDICVVWHDASALVRPFARREELPLEQHTCVRVNPAPRR
jgi:hypothetical protein